MKHVKELIKDSTLKEKIEYLWNGWHHGGSPNYNSATVSKMALEQTDQLIAENQNYVHVVNTQNIQIESLGKNIAELKQQLEEQKELVEATKLAMEYGYHMALSGDDRIFIYETSDSQEPVAELLEWHREQKGE